MVQVARLTQALINCVEHMNMFDQGGGGFRDTQACRCIRDTEALLFELDGGDPADYVPEDLCSNCDDAHDCTNHDVVKA